MSLPQWIQNGCYDYRPDYETSYGYTPWLSAGIIFCTLFGLSGLVHIAQSIWTRQWWGFLFVLGALTEVIGWAGRTWSAKCPYNNNAFLMQISTLIIAPTFFTAGIYVILGRLIQIMGPSSSPIKPKMYLWIFCTCDVLSLVIQAVGGGLASEASSEVNGDTKPGTDTMVAGIVFQLASITVFTYLLLVFLQRVRRQVLPRELQLLVAASCFSVAMIYARSVYRTVELLQGWSGFLITHQVYFVVLDGALMVAAVGIFNILNPGWLLRTAPKSSESDKMELNETD
ncbi:sphingosine hydroxylase [Physcia stellaris]|nr:sphingosine hydroxylase [Physcia stellaris]